MHDALKKLKSKKDRPMTDLEKEAKLSILGSLKDQAGQALANRVRGIKKATVVAKDEEGLKEGLDKAKDLVSKMPEAEDQVAEAGDDVAEEMAESSEEEASEQEGHDAAPGEEHKEEMSEEELDAKLKELMAMKEKLKSKKSEG